MDDLLLKFTKSLKQMTRERLIKECFHPNKHECVQPIKQAHSLQRNGRLSLIEEEINGQNCLYTVSRFSSTKKVRIKDFIPVGKKEASTFYGFCSKHDTEVFAPIENFPFDGSDKHLFLHSYRSFAHSYHNKKQELQLYKSEWEVMKELPIEITEQLIIGAELGLNDIELEKEYLDNLLINEQYDGLIYSLLETLDFYPFGSSSSITPHFTVKNTPLEEDIDDPNKPWTSIMLTVVPDKKNSFIIVASNPNNDSGVAFLNDLEELDDEKYLHAISSMITTMSENTFWSPKLWDSLSESLKIVMRNNAQYLFDSTKSQKFPWSSINLYQDRFTATSLGIVK